MRNKHLFGMALAAVMTAACSYVDEPVDAPRSGGLSATVEGSRSSTRAGFAEDGAFYWSNKDYLGVTTSDCMTSFSTLELTSGGGTAKAGFEGTVLGEIKGYAIYPVSDYHRLNDKTLTYHLPETYIYKQVDADYFTTTQGDGNSFNPPMWGSIIDNGNNKAVTLQHLGGVLCVKIPEMPVEAGTFILSADEQITGNFTADLSVSEPVIATPTEEGAAATATSAVSGNNEVTIAFSGASQGSHGVFYVPVPTGTYHNVRVKVTDGTTAKVNVVAGVYTVNRKDLKKIEPTSGSVEATVATESGSLSDAANALASNDAVAVTNKISGTSNSINIPGVSSSTGATSKSLSLEQVASGASLTVNDANVPGDTDASVQNFTLSIPNNETQGFDALDVTINMPHTTVTLAGNGGIATYGDVTASTADNTLVLSSGVKVNKVIVKKGNIRVNKGAELVAIEKDKENTAEIVTVYVEEGAEIPTLPDGFKVASDDELVTLKMTAAKGGSYTMTGDLTLDEPLVVETGVTFTLDLNGHALKANPAGLTKVLNTSDAVVLVRRGATLTINDSKGQGSIDANNVETVYCAVKLTDTNDGTDGTAAKLVVNNGQLIGNYYGISGNGTRHNTEITINGGIVKANNANEEEGGTGIYHPQDGTLKVTAGTIEGLNSGIELRSGNLNISGGIIRSSATEFKTGPNGNGTTLIGTAVGISQHTTNKAISVTISGGTLEGIYALYEEDLQDEQVDNIQISGVSGGTFNGKIYSENCTQFISGGTFSDPSALAYLAANANVSVALNADYEGPGFGIFVNGNGASATVDIDLGGHTWTLNDDPLFGSPGTVSQYFHLEKGATVTLKNGTVTTQNTASDKMLFQNYCNLTLDGVKVLGGTSCKYVMSNNNGSCTIRNSTVTATEGNCAFDVYYWSAGGYPEGVTVTVDNSIINGRVEFGGQRSSDDTSMKGKLIIQGTNTVMNGNLVVTEGYYDETTPNILISGGTFSDPSALAYLTEKADVNVNFTGDTELAQTIIVPKGNVIIDLGDHTLTTAATATEFNNKVTAIAVKDGATATVKNGNIGNASAGMFYGVYAYGEANVMLKNVHFSDRVTYAYNGKGKLDATSCTFRGWLSAWHYGGTFNGCTFTIGKEWYPAAICYGSTTFSNCKFFKNGTDADTYGDSRKPDSDGYYRCNYVVAGCNPATTIDFTDCEFIDKDGVKVGDITTSDHPYHACGWGDGKIANAQITVGGVEITSQCTDASQPQE